MNPMSLSDVFPLVIIYAKTNVPLVELPRSSLQHCRSLFQIAFGILTVLASSSSWTRNHLPRDARVLEATLLTLFELISMPRISSDHVYDYILYIYLIILL